MRSKTILVCPRGYDNLMEASRLYQSGWRVVLIIDSGLLSTPIPSGRTVAQRYYGFVAGKY